MKKSTLNIYIRLAKLFKKHGFSLYMVGGTSRDYLLSRYTDDLDLATDALVDEMLKILPEDYDIRTPFKKYGNLKIKMDDLLVDITTFRSEQNYQDSRHPQSVQFVKSLEIDAKRRDFTINALYIDETLLNIYDFYDGVDDLINHRIKMIGDPQVRIEEDPLRILRAIRFSLKLNFEIDETLKECIINNISLLKRLNPVKVNEEICKMKEINPVKTEQLLNLYGIVV